MASPKRRAAALLVALGIFAFTVLAVAIKAGYTQTFDAAVLTALPRPASRGFQESVRDISALGGGIVLGLVTLVIAGFLAFERRGRLAVYLCGSITAGFLVAPLLKSIFNRPRPELVPHLVYAGNTSFPSGHAMMSSLTYFTLAILLAHTCNRRSVKIYLVATAGFISFVVGISRVYLGVHWPTDVICGWLAGAVWALLSWFGAQRLRPSFTRS